MSRENVDNTSYGRSPAAVHEPVGQAPAAIARGLEGHRDHAGGDHRQQHVRLVARADQRADPDHDGQVDHRESGAEQPVDHGSRDEQVDVEQAVAQDGQADGDRDAKPSTGRENGSCQVERGGWGAQPEVPGKQEHQAEDRQGTSVGEPLDLLTLHALGALEPHQQGHDGGNSTGGQHQCRGVHDRRAQRGTEGFSECCPAARALWPARAARWQPRPPLHPLPATTPPPTSHAMAADRRGTAGRPAPARQCWDTTRPRTARRPHHRPATSARRPSA